MSLNLGDGVIKILADTTEMDMAFERLKTDVPRKMEPVTVAANRTTGTWNVMGRTFLTTGRSAQIAGDQAGEASEKIVNHSHRAKDSIDLLAGSFGIVLPRELKKYLASLEGVNAILAGAFKLSIVLAFIEVIVQASDKLAAFLSDMFIYTKVAQAAYAAQVQLNTALVESSEKAKALKKEFELLGTDGAARSRKEAALLAVELAHDGAEMANVQARSAEMEEKLKLLVPAMEAVKNGTASSLQEFEVWSAGGVEAIERMMVQASNAKNEIVKRGAEITAKQQEQRNAEKQAAIQALEESIRHNQAIIDGRKSAAEALAALALSEQIQIGLVKKKGYIAQVEAEQEYQQKLYEVGRKAAEDNLAQLERNKTKNKDEIVKVNAEIQVLDAEHQKRLIDIQNKGIEAYHEALRSKAQTTIMEIGKSNDQIANATTKTFDKLDAAFQTLGSDGALVLGERLKEMEDAYKQLRESGLATTMDLKLGEEQLLMMKIRVKELTGEQTDEERARLQAIQEELAKVDYQTKNVYFRQLDLFKMWQKEGPKTGRVMHDLSGMGKAALNSLASAFEQSIATAILSEDSFGHAMRSATAQILAQIAARSAVLAIWEAAQGFASLAVYDYVAADLHFQAAAIYGGVAVVAGASAYAINPKDKGKDAGMSGTPIETDGSKNGTTTAVVSPVQTRNVQRFAAGALVSRPTLAMIGDTRRGGTNTGQEEGVIPLEDPTAMDAIANRIAERGAGGGINIYVDGLISPDNLSKVIKQINRHVDTGRARLTSSTARRVTKKG